MSITIKINTDNDAFKPDPQQQVWSILANLTKRVLLEDLHPGTRHHMRDINGNTVGSFVWNED